MEASKISARILSLDKSIYVLIYEDGNLITKREVKHDCFDAVVSYFIKNNEPPVYDIHRNKVLLFIDFASSENALLAEDNLTPWAKAILGNWHKEYKNFGKKEFINFVLDIVVNKFPRLSKDFDYGIEEHEGGMTVFLSPGSSIACRSMIDILMDNMNLPDAGIFVLKNQDKRFNFAIEFQL